MIRRYTEKLSALNLILLLLNKFLWKNRKKKKKREETYKIVQKSSKEYKEKVETTGYFLVIRNPFLFLLRISESVPW